MKIKESLLALVPSIEACNAIAAARRSAISRSFGEPTVAQYVTCFSLPESTEPVPLPNLGELIKGAGNGA